MRRATKKKKTAARGAGRKAPTRRQRAERPGAMFAGLRHGDGCAAMVVVAERTGDCWDEVRRVVEMPIARAASGSSRGGAGEVEKVVRAFSAVGHVQRVRILRKLLDGPATYRSLLRVTRLEAGPLYHHVNQLRLAGLILPKQRDLYELTRGGRNLILIALAAAPQVKDARRRPVAPAL